MSKITAIVLAAGNGSRMKSTTKKQFMEIKGKPIIWYSINAFEQSQVDQIILVTGQEDVEYCNILIDKYGFLKVSDVVVGGNERYESVYNGLKKAAGDIVLIHDGARPFVSNTIIDRSIEETNKHHACVVGMPVKDTIKMVDNEKYVIETPDRSSLWITQTPQTFKKEIIIEAYEKFRLDMTLGKEINITDDAMIVEKYTDNKVKFIEGSYSNIKITTPDDILLAQSIVG